MRLVPSALILILLQISQPFASEATPLEGTTSVFGVDIGVPLSIGACPSSVPNFELPRLLAASTGNPCAITSSIQIAPNIRVYEIWFPAGRLPDWVVGGFLLAYTIEGSVEAIDVRTNGLTVQRDVYRALREKFGPQNSIEFIQKQNSFGAQFESIVAHWKFGRIHIAFQGFLETADEGLVDFATVRADDLMRKLLNSDQKDRVPF